MPGHRVLTPALLLLTVGTGCPHDWMIGGTMDEAMQKDYNEKRRETKDCPPHLPRHQECPNPEDQLSCFWVCD